MTSKQKPHSQKAEGVSSMPFKVPEKIHLLPSGSFKGKDGRGPYCVIDGDSLIRYSLLQAGGKLVVDYNHQTDFSGPSSATAAPAAGWLTSLYWDKQGLWGRVSWTKKAITAIRSGEYRCISPVFFHEKNGHVTQLLRASLTNDPNLALRALNNRKKEHASEKLSQAMGVGMNVVVDDSSADTFVHLGHRLDSLEKQMHQAHVEQAIASGVLPPALKGWAKEYCRRDPEGFDAFLQKCPVFALAPKEPPLPQKPKTTPTLTSQEKSVCRQLGLDAVDFLQHKNTRKRRPNVHETPHDIGFPKGLQQPSQAPQEREDVAHRL